MKFDGRETLFQDESDLRHYTGEKAHYLFERDIYILARKYKQIN